MDGTVIFSKYRNYKTTFFKNIQKSTVFKWSNTAVYSKVVSLCLENQYKTEKELLMVDF